MQISCHKNGNVDPFDVQNGLTREDIKNSLMKNPSLTKKRKEEALKNAAPIPTISKLIITPPPPVIGGSKTISFSVTDQVPLKDVLIELGRIAKIDIDLDPSISGGVIINATNRSLKEVIDRIATQGNLRYSYNNGVLYFERDTPYMINYFVDYLIDGDLWSDVETNVNTILTSSSTEDLNEESLAAASSISSNKSAGILSVFATEEEQNLVKDYLADVERSASAQVLIEAKIVEVSLTDSYDSGINWELLEGNNTLSSANAISSSLTPSLAYTGSKIFGTENLTASISALSTFGTTRTISSPRIHAINNQKASLDFGDKLVYFKIDSNQDVTTDSGGTASTTSTISSSKQEEDIGVQLEITPSINVETDYIVMRIAPTLSVLSEYVTDPASPTSDGTTVISNEVPVIQTRSISTIAKVKSGGIIVIGGLMKDTTSNTDSGIPFLNNIPVLGWLFKSSSKSTTLVETVIFIKATILKDGYVGKNDRNIQEKFDTNRRRFFDY